MGKLKSEIPKALQGLATRVSVASDSGQMRATETVRDTAGASKSPSPSSSGDESGFGDLKTLPLVLLYDLGILVRLVASLTSDIPTLTPTRTTSDGSFWLRRKERGKG